MQLRPDLVDVRGLKTVVPLTNLDLSLLDGAAEAAPETADVP